MRRVVIIVMAGILVGAQSACSSSGSGGSGGTTAAGGPSAPASTSTSVSGATGSAAATPADPATKAAVAKAYSVFFDPSTGLAASEANLQNGAKLKSALMAQAKAGAQEQLSAKVTKVSLLSPNSAAVVFDLLSAGKMLLPDTPGNAARVNGHWVVAAKTFCGLVQLTGKVPAACNDPSVTDLPH